MANPLRTHRSSEAPMDYEYTSRPSTGIKPVWAQQGDAPGTPRKRPFEDTNTPVPAFPPSPHTPSFGSNTNAPFLFQAPPPQTPQVQPWAPPPNFTPSKVFAPAPDVDVRDVDMSELSPSATLEERKDEGRTIAPGALRRVFKGRERARTRSPGKPRRQRVRGDTSVSDSEEDAPVAQSTSNHYTLNMPSAPVPTTDLPYVLLGYLQFFFNLSLILLFLYLLVQFILTIQRDVEHRISEYSMDIVQEIAMCASQYKSNLCSTNPVPAMVHQCANWETCMNRDPTIVGRAKVGAELIAEVFNGFVEPITWKTLAFTLTSLTFLTVFINALLSLYRSRILAHPAPPPLPHHPSFPIAPPAAYVPPDYEYLPPPSNGRGRSWKSELDEVAEEPTRRRRLEGGRAAKVR